MATIPNIFQNLHNFGAWLFSQQIELVKHGNIFLQPVL